MEWHQVLIKPWITEKGTQSLENKESKYLCYPFEVNIHATKTEVKKAFQQMTEEVYDKQVDVHRVNTVKVLAKARRRGPHLGRSRQRKKAMVYISQDYALEIF
tara:strand:- start:38 stop:346 length:309 start_codon:yes stop_codon:yes gene_type:complete